MDSKNCLCERLYVQINEKWRVTVRKAAHLLIQKPIPIIQLGQVLDDFSKCLDDIKSLHGSGAGTERGVLWFCLVFSRCYLCLFVRFIW